MIYSESLNLLLRNLVWWCIIIIARLSSKRLVCCHQGQGHSEGSYNQNTTFKYVIWTADPFAAKLGLMAHHHKVDCLVRRLDCSVVVKVTVTEKVQNASECSSEQYLLSCYLVWWCSIMGQTVMQENWFAISKVKVIARAHMIKIWQFLLYLLNCWSFCY